MRDQMPYDESKPLYMHNLQFDLAAAELELEPWIAEKIKHPRQELVGAKPAEVLLDRGRREPLNLRLNR